MNSTSFRDIYKSLCTCYRIKYNQDECKEYYNSLKKYGAKKVNNAVEHAKETIKFFPSVAELVEIINTLPQEYFWNEKDCKREPMTPEEKEEFNMILKELEG